jgi:hypothetical protein
MNVNYFWERGVNGFSDLGLFFSLVSVLLFNDNVGYDHSEFVGWRGLVNIRYMPRHDGNRRGEHLARFRRI